VPNNKKIIWIKKSVLETIKEDLHKWYPVETGGVLMGYWNGDEVVISQIIDGGPKASRTRKSFNPDHDYQLEEISRIYKLSGRTETYLGDWHTHPDAKAYLSNRDKKTLSNIAKHKAARQPMPLMMIFGTNPAEIRIWCGCPVFLNTNFVELNYQLFE
jgi:integrative and conjugative element protein (TIGR02256 family)